jgi:hypothetical protein
VFRVTADGVIEGDGFTVALQGRAGLRYCEGTRCMDVDGEVLMGPSGYVVDSRSIRRWDPPHADEPIDAAKRAAIVANIRRALASRGYDIEVD